MANPQRYLILPARGLQATPNNASSAAGATLMQIAGGGRVAPLRTRLRSFVRSSEKRAGKKPKAAGAHVFDVVASIDDTSVKLVEATPEMIAALRYEQPGLRAIPEVFYRPAVAIVELRKRLTRPAATVAAA